MKILHLISGKANPNRANGVNQVVHGLAKYMSRLGHEVRVLGISTSAKTNGEVVEREGFSVEVHRSFLLTGAKRFKELAADCDIIHLHGVWNKMNILAGHYCTRMGKPYVVTPHGMFAKDRVRQSHYLSKLACHYCIQRRFLNRAAAIHALSSEELRDIAHYCRNKALFVVPNGVDEDALKGLSYAARRGRAKIRLGYLGRLSPEKNIESLLHALALLPPPCREQVELYLIGPLERHSVTLKELSKKLKLDDIVHFVGPRYGRDKANALLELDLYIHPAYSEGFSLAIAEALFLGLPSIISSGSNMSDYDGTGAFMICAPTAPNLCRAMVDMLSQQERWAEMSARARELCQTHFTWQLCADELLRHYQALCEKS